MRGLFLALFLLMALGCASTINDNTRASGDSSATIRTGIITTQYDSDGDIVSETCGTAESPCEERTSVGGEGSLQFWESVTKWVSFAASIGMLAFGGGL